MIGVVAARSILARLREYVGDRRRSPRRGLRFAGRVPALVTLLEAGAEYATGASQPPSVAAETRDLGLSGLTVLTGRVRVGGQYLTDLEHHLGVRLELPAGEVHLLAKVVRFEHRPEAGSEAGYLLGLRIIKVREDERALYAGFLRTLAPLERRRRERESGRQELIRLATPGGQTPTAEEVVMPQDVARAFESFLGRNRPGGRS